MSGNGNDYRQAADGESRVKRINKTLQRLGWCKVQWSTNTCKCTLSVQCRSARSKHILQSRKNVRWKSNCLVYNIEEEDEESGDEAQTCINTMSVKHTSTDMNIDFKFQKSIYIFLSEQVQIQTKHIRTRAQQTQSTRWQ